MSFYNSVNSSLDLIQSLCLNLTVTVLNLNTLSATRLVVLFPISIYILHLGIQQWRQHHSLKAASHSDIFTYNLAALELIWSLGVVLYFSGVFSDFAREISTVYFFYALIFFAETSFHILTCVDRYLAVVHPVMYLKLRNTRGVAIRNVSIFCVWLISLPVNFISQFETRTLRNSMFFIYLVVSLIVVSFCSLSILLALFRPGPGAGGGNRGHIDQTKQRAFVTVMAIMAVLCLFFSGFLVSFTLMVSEVMCKGVSYAVHSAVMWVSLPSSFVLPLLYLHKAGKLVWKKKVQQLKG